MLASDVVVRAYREAAIKSVNSPALTPAEEEEGLARLNDFLFSLFGDEIGENFSDWQVPQQQRRAGIAANFSAQIYPGTVNNRDQVGPSFTSRHDISPFPPANSRLLLQVQLPTTVYFPEAPNDGARMAVVDTGSTDSVILDGNGRLIDGAQTLTFNPGDPPVKFFYRADLGSWIVLAPLALTDNTPLPPEYDVLLVTGTAIRLTALDEIEPGASTVATFTGMLKKARRQFRQYSSAANGGQDIVNSFQAYEGTTPW